MFYKVEYLWPHAISLAVSLLLVLAAWWKPKLARWGFAALFAWACAVNGYTASTRPHVYLEYAPLAISETYRGFIVGHFAAHIPAFVGTIAAGQGAISLGILLPAPLSRVALGGAIVFLLAIAPLGVGSAFPATVLMALGAGVLARKPELARAALGSRRHDPTRAAGALDEAGRSRDISRSSAR